MEKYESLYCSLTKFSDLLNEIMCLFLRDNAAIGNFGLHIK